MIYLDSSALLKFVKAEPESHALRKWRIALKGGGELLTSQSAVLEITRTPQEGGVRNE